MQWTIRHLTIIAMAATLGSLAPAQQPYPPQGGQYPPQQGGQYPGGQYPQQGGGLQIPTIHIPKRKSKEDREAEKAAKAEAKAASTLKLAAIEGRLRRLTPKELLLEGKKGEVLRFRLVAKTQFRRKSGEPMRDSLLNPGDRLSLLVDPEDAETAILVSFLEAGGQNERAAADLPVNEAVMRVPAAADLGKPKEVKLGGAVEPEVGATEGAAAAAPTESKPVDAADKLILESAREAALKYGASIPNFIAQVSTERSFKPQASAAAWKPLDVVAAEEVYSYGRETYRNKAIDGRETNRPIEETGTWSAGEFGLAVEALMAEEADAKFRRRAGGPQRTGGDERTAWIFEYSVTAANSAWALQTPDGREFKPGYTGAVWIDQASRRVVRIERKAVGLQDDFPFGKVESAVTYRFVKWGGAGEKLMPASGDRISCVTGGSCTRNVTTFSEYRGFGAEPKVAK